MKFLFISPRYSGGIGGHAEMLANQLQCAGHSVTKMKAPHIPIKNLKNPSFAIFGAIKGILNRENYDIVHAFNVPSAFAMRYAKGKKKILSVHGMFSEQVNSLHSKAISSIASDTSLTLRSNAAVATSGDATWSIISSRVKKAGDNAPNASLIFSGNSLAAGLTVGNSGVLSTLISNDFTVPGNNVIRANRAGYDRYNFAFRINKRTYNQTPLLNTRGEITPVSRPDDARKVMVPKMGDLSEFQGQIMNVDVTRLNPKTHIERSISVVGSQINI